MRRPPAIAVIGAGNANQQVSELAYAVGVEVASSGARLVCGGLGGVMEHAARGARNGGGITIGILPGTDPETANRWIDIPIATGLGHARNAIVVASADAVIALEGAAGTLSEIGLAGAYGRPVVALRAWRDLGLRLAESPKEAVHFALQEIANR